MELVQGGHQMKRYSGVHQMELIQRWASDGAGTRVCIRWSWYRGVHQMELEAKCCIRDVDEMDLLYHVSSTLNFLLAINVCKRRQRFFKLI